MLNLKYVRETPHLVKETLQKKGQVQKIAWVDEILHLDEDARQLKGVCDQLRSRRNNLSLEINAAKKAGKETSSLFKEAASIPQQITEKEGLLAELQEKITHYLLRLPNLLHTSVPLGKDESQNPVRKLVGKPRTYDFNLQSHSELAESLGVADFEQGRMVSGQGFNYLSGSLAQLDLALQRYGIDYLLQRGFTVLVPPLLLRREALSGAVDLSAFEEVIYKVEGEDLYLVGTAEHTLVNFFKDKTFKKEDLPIKVCAVTPCFRKEIGGHGVDTKGIFRMHQFNKVEQVVVSTQEDSFSLLEEMEEITESFFESLGIPFRVIDICSGDLGNKMAKQYDIEAWMPRQGTYREVTSAGNCTDYQSYSLNVKYTDGKEKKYVHLLNNTMVATSRAMVAILENYQQKDGSINIPAVLVPYMNGLKEIRKEKE